MNPLRWFDTPTSHRHVEIRSTSASTLFPGWVDHVVTVLCSRDACWTCQGREQVILR